MISNLLVNMQMHLDSDVFETTRGVPQGFTTSPLLFAIYLDYILRDYADTLRILAYADDIVIHFYSEDCLIVG